MFERRAVVWLSYLKYEVTGGYLKLNDIVCMIFLYVEVRKMIFISFSFRYHEVTLAPLKGGNLLPKNK